MQIERLWHSATSRRAIRQHHARFDCRHPWTSTAPESGSQSGTTKSVISPGQITITGKDEGGTSQQAANTLASRDASTANGALSNNLTLVQAQDIAKNQKEAQDDIRAAGILGSVGAELIGDAAQKNNWSAETKVLAHGLLGAGLAVIGGGSAGTGFLTGAANEMAVNAMSDYLVNNGVVKGSDDYKQLMMAGSAFLGTAVGKAAGGTTTDVALSGQTAKVATENNHNKHHSQINDPNSKGNKASILANAQACNGPNSCEGMAAGMAGQASTLTDDKIAGMCGSDTVCIANRKDERATYLEARDLAIAKTGPEGAAKIYLESQAGAPYSKSELGAAVTRFQNGNAQSGNPVDEYVRNSMDPVMFAAVLGISPIDTDGGKSGGRRSGGAGSAGNTTPLGLGSTGRTTPNNLGEDLAMRQAMGFPAEGRPLPVPMTDPRWPASDGWVKMAQNVNGVEVHYVRNVRTGARDDFKFK